MNKFIGWAAVTLTAVEALSGMLPAMAANPSPEGAANPSPAATENTAPTGTAPAPASASPLVADRPGFTNSTETVPPGRIQLEGGYVFIQNGRNQDHVLGQWLLRVPTGPGFELEAGIPSADFSKSLSGTTSGFQDLSLGFKTKLLKASEHFNILRPGVALIASTSIPTGSTAFRAPHLQPFARFEFAWPLSDKYNLGASLDDSYASQNGQQFNQFDYSGSVSYNFNSRLSTFLEFYSLVPGAPSGSNSNYVDSALIYLAGNNVQFDINGGIGLNSVRPDFFIGTGIVRRW